MHIFSDTLLLIIILENKCGQNRAKSHSHRFTNTLTDGRSTRIVATRKKMLRTHSEDKASEYLSRE